MDGSFSHRHFALKEEELFSLVFQELAPLFPNLQAVVAKCRVHRWRFAIPVSLFEDRFLECSIENSGKIVFAGDAFQEARVEGAFLSGRAAGLRLRQLFEKIKE
jgi:predicted NAD/FAD-dependent oxidoreductase